jgi:hypothetical protein
MAAAGHGQSARRRRRATRPAPPANPATTTAPSTKGSGDPADGLATADDGATFRILGPDDWSLVPEPIAPDGDGLSLATEPAFGVVPLGDVVDPVAAGAGVE